MASLPKRCLLRVGSTHSEQREHKLCLYGEYWIHGFCHQPLGFDHEINRPRAPRRFGANPEQIRREREMALHGQ